MQIIVAGTNLQAMFKAADGVIKKYGDVSMREVPENIKGQSTLSALKRMFGGSHFNICAIDDLKKLHNVEISNEHYEWMRVLHCVDFTDMHPDTREYLFAVCVEYFKTIISMSYAELSK